MYRSCLQRCSVRGGILRNFAKFTRKHLCQGLFFNKVAGLRPATLLKKRLWHRCFPVNFVNLLRTTFLQNTSGGLLLNVKLLYENYTQPLRKNISIKQMFKVQLLTRTLSIKSSQICPMIRYLQEYIESLGYID